MTGETIAALAAGGCLVVLVSLTVRAIARAIARALAVLYSEDTVE